MKKIKEKSKAILFDMDGVITDTMSYHYDAWRAVLLKSGISVSCWDIYCREGQDGLTSVKDIFRQYGVPLGIGTARAILSEKEELFKATVRRRFVKGSRSFVRLLKRKGLLLALVTGTSRHEMHRILPDSLFGLFDVTVTGSDVKKGKPHPEPFLKALAKLKASPDEAAVIENAPFGIEAAKRAGLFCFALETSLPRRYLSGADRIVSSFTGLKKALAR